MVKIVAFVDSVCFRECEVVSMIQRDVEAS